MLVALVLVLLLLATLYGPATLVFPFCLVSGFLLGFGAIRLSAEMQVSENPGIENVEPTFWSTIYNGWLYSTDPEGWVRYATLNSLIVGVLVGSVFGILLLSRIQTAYGLIESWLAGMFLICLLAVSEVKS